MLLPFTLISTLCFLGGAAFGYFVVFPPAFRFLVGYSSEIPRSHARGQRILFPGPAPAPCLWHSFSNCRCLWSFSPRSGWSTGRFCAENRKYAVLHWPLSIAAILTPTPDVVNQLFMAGPLVVLYEVSIFAVALFARRPLAAYAEAQGQGHETDGEE